MERICSAALLTLGLMATSISPAQAQTAQEALRQYVSDLQKAPADMALREKIIRHVQTMKKNPPIPEQAEKFEGRAEFAAKSAKTEADFADAAREYEKALLAAPWVAAYYFNLGVMQEKAGQTQAAKQNFEFYLLAAPNALDARDVRKRIAGLEYAMEKAAKESSTLIAEEKQNTFEDLLKKIDGRRYTAPGMAEGSQLIIDVRGRAFVTGTIDAYGKYEADVRIEIQGRTTTHPYRVANPSYLSITYAVSEDGDRITRTDRTTGGNFDHIYLWQR